MKYKKYKLTETEIIEIIENNKQLKMPEILTNLGGQIMIETE